MATEKKPEKSPEPGTRNAPEPRVDPTSLMTAKERARQNQLRNEKAREVRLEQLARRDPVVRELLEENRRLKAQGSKKKNG